MSLWAAGAVSNANSPVYQGCNYLINGNFSVSQRGSEYIQNSSNKLYALDRWMIEDGVGTLNSIKVKQLDISGQLTGSRFAAKMTRITNSNYAHIRQYIESNNSINLQGKYATISFYARIGSGANVNSKIAIWIGGNTGIDGSSGTGSNPAYIDELTTSTSWKKYTLTTTSVISTTVNTVSADIMWYATSGGDLTDNDCIQIAQVQLNEGTVALPFEQEDYGTTLAKCQRYGIELSNGVQYGVIGSGFMLSASQGLINIDLPVEMRKIPSIVADVTKFKIWYTGDLSTPVTTINGGTLDPVSTRKKISIKCSIGISITAGYGCNLFGDSTSPTFFLDAELT